MPQKGSKMKKIYTFSHIYFFKKQPSEKLGKV